MGFKCGIVGLQNVGKSTLFNALTKNKVAAENYPFCTIDPNVGIVMVLVNALGAEKNKEAIPGEIKNGDLQRHYPNQVVIIMDQFKQQVLEVITDLLDMNK